MYFSNTLTAAAVLALVNAAALSSRTTGKATFYGGNVSGGTCSFVGYTIPSGLYGVAMGEVNWDGARTCGGCLEITGPKGNKITAQVVDQCPECDAGHLDLFPDAFAKLDDPSKGIIPITWNYVDCPITSAITLRNKEGTSPYWFSMQVINANKRVSTLEFSTNGGSSWTGTERKYYNYFEYPAGSKTSTVDIKITSIDGDVLTVKNVGIGAGVTATASGNFDSGNSAVAESSSKNVENTTETVEEASTPTPTLEVTQAPAVIVKPAVVPTQAQESAQPAVATSTEAPVETKPAAPPARPEEAKQEPAKQLDEPAESQAESVKAKLVDIKPTSLTTLTTQVVPVPSTTPVAVKHLATASAEKVVTVTITGCPASTATPSTTKRSPSGLLSRMLRM